MKAIYQETWTRTVEVELTPEQEQAFKERSGEAYDEVVQTVADEAQTKLPDTPMERTTSEISDDSDDYNGNPHWEE